MDNTEFKRRRQQLISQLEDNSVLILAGNTLVTRNNDSHYRFRQDSDFYYLTGFEEPESVMVLLKDNAKSHYILFNRPSCYEQELWEGYRAGQHGACAEYGADESFPIQELEHRIKSLLINKSHIYYRIGNDPLIDKHLPSWLGEIKKAARKGLHAPETFHDIGPVLSEMRLFKSPAEIATLRRVCELSAHAHVQAMKQAPKVTHEYQLEATLTHAFINKGCRAAAYDPIVAAGANACILHYTSNNQIIPDDALILIDAGGELDNYAADITRTFPKSGRFTAPQKAIYQLVLKAQLAGLECIKPGTAWTTIQDTMVKVITEGLVSLGILQGDVAALIEQKAYQRFYMHGSGHWLGLDVHDAGSYKQQGQWRSLQPGMVLTVEPGIYIDARHQDVDSCWHGIGVRIEDDLLITDTGYENLTHAVPKTVEEIEALIQDAI